MDVLKFRAKSLQEALEAVRNQLGPDAEVLETREVKSNRLGLFTSSLIEVEATSPQPSFRSQPTQADSLDMEELGSQHSASAEPTVFQGDTSGQFNRLPSRPSASDPVAGQVERNLIAAGFSSRCAAEIVQATKRDIGPYQPTVAEFEAEVNSVLAKQLPTGGVIHPVKGQKLICGFVGTSGVGKTQALSQIAAGIRFEYGCRLGLIAADSEKVGSAGQMQHFAEFISAPIEVVNAPADMQQAITNLVECDVVLIDTPAMDIRGKDNAVAKEFLAAANANQVFLVLNTTSQVGLAKRSLSVAAQMNASNLILTHLDEADCSGSWYPLLRHPQLPVSYLGIGRQIPEDLVIAHPRRLARELQCGPHF